MKSKIISIVYSFVLGKLFKAFLNLNIKPLELKLNETDKCLIIAPHPDDESIGCAGIMNTHPNLFKVICLTHKNTEDRNKEFIEAMNFAQIKDFEIKDLTDKHIINDYTKFKNIDISEYDYIFISNIFDQHKDHKAVSILLMQLLEEKQHKKDLKIAYYEVWSTLMLPSHFFNISKVINKKTDMINIYKSQIATKDYANKITGLNSYRGLLKSIEYAEAFSIMSTDDFIRNVKLLKD